MSQFIITEDDNCLRVEIKGKPGHITIKAEDEGYTFQLRSTLGDESVAAAYFPYKGIQEDKNS